MATNTTSKKLKPVLVTTAHRGVFFGHIKDNKKVPKEITLTSARNGIYWQDTGGFIGLASKGPNANCRIGATIGELTLYDVTSVSAVTPEAEKAWLAASTYGAK